MISTIKDLESENIVKLIIKPILNKELHKIHLEQEIKNQNYHRI